MSTEATTHLTDDLLDSWLQGTLAPDIETGLVAHIEHCPECKATYGDVLMVLGALPYADLPGAEQFDERASWESIAANLPLRTRAQTPIKAEPLQNPILPFTPAGFRGSWATLAAVAVIALALGIIVGQVLPRLGDDESVKVIQVEFVQPEGNATANLRYLPDEQVFVFSVDGLAPPPDGYVYQAWLINGDGPVPTGVIQTGDTTIAAHGNPAEYATFAITLEKGPIGAPAPTTDPIIVADLTKS